MGAARALVVLTVFFISFNLFAGLLMSSGAAATLGIDATVGEDQATDDLTNENDLATGSPTSGTLFGLYNVVSSQLAGFFEYIFPGLRMIGRFGVPNEIINMLGGVFSVITPIGVASFLRGFNL